MTMKTHIEIVARAAFVAEVIFLLMLPLAWACVHHVDASASAAAVSAYASAGVPFILFVLFLANPHAWPNPLRWLRERPRTRYIAAGCMFGAAVMAYVAGTCALVADWAGMATGLAITVATVGVGIHYVWAEPTGADGHEATPAVAT